MPSTSRFAISSVISQFGISRFVTSRFASAAFVLLTCALLPAVQERSTLSAQTVRGRVTDGRDQAVPGAVVTLLDSADQIVARALTPEDGTFRLTVARPGTYRLRTARIGFQPTLLPSIQLGRGETRVQAVRIAFIPIALAAVRVAARSACHSDESADAANAFALWDQVRTALTATQLSASARSVTATTITFQRALEPRQRRIRQQSQQLRTDYVSQPWRAAPLDSIRRFGYVLTDANDISTFFAPDLNVLLSSTFLEDHCLRVGESEVPGEVALAFEPNAARANVVDIQGMMILDRATGALRRMEFGYTGAARSIAQHGGGTMGFAQLTNGGWAITRWEIRMPVIVRDDRGREVRVDALQSTGGELVVARRGADTLFKRRPGVLTGTVVDSASGAPVPVAHITLDGTTDTTRADRRGQFTLRDIMPGIYALDVRTPSLDSIGAVHRSTVTFTDSTQLIRIAVPTGLQLAGGICGANRAAVAGRDGILLGTITESLGGASLAQVRVSVDWTEWSNVRGQLSSRSRRLESRSSAGGDWHICGVPTDTRLTIRAFPDSGRAEPVELRLADNARVSTATLVVDRAAEPVAGVMGVVVANDSVATPVRDAEVVLPGLSRSVRTNALGEFRLDDLEVGTHELVVRRLGFGPLATQLTLAAGELEERRVVLSRVTVLDSVEVRAEFVLPSFEENRRVGLGRFLTRDELAKMEGRSFEAVINRFSGVEMERGRGTNSWLMSSRRTASLGSGNFFVPEPADSALGARPACYAHVYLDNVPVFTSRPGEPLFNLNSISPDAIEALEYYAGPSSTPARYTALRATCGVLVIWTRR